MAGSMAMGLGLVILYLGAESTLRGARAIGLRAGLSPIVVGLTIVAFGTSAPEFVVSLRGALAGHDAIALGNVVGSNVCNVLLILGLSALIRPLDVHTRFLVIDVPLLVAVSVVVGGLLLVSQGLGRIAGALLVGGLVVYTVSCIRRARSESEAEVAEIREAQPPLAGTIAVDIAFTLAGLGMLVWGASSFVSGASQVALGFGVPENVIALTAVAIGTSLPEMSSTLVAAVRGQGDIAIGGVVGSNLFNLLGILGVVALTRPIGLGGVRSLDLGVMVLAAVLLFVFLYTRRRLERWEGAVLLGGFVLYLSSLFVGSMAMS